MPLKLFVIDRKTALFPVAPHDFERGYLEITLSPVVQALVTQFERCWSTAVDPRKHVMPPITLSQREQSLIALLAQGHTDASAARELRISARSVTTILRGLMDRLGVDNRFQLGIALGAFHAQLPTDPASITKEES